MLYALRYIYHFLVSNSRHGTHSPFVYALADQVIYNSHYKPQRFIELPVGFNFRYFGLVQKILSFWEIDKLSTDLYDQQNTALWLDVKNQIDLEQILRMVSRGKVIIVHAPYSKRGYHLWKQLICEDSVIVSINLFHFGILVHRHGQTKEDFLLRYPVF